MICMEVNEMRISEFMKKVIVPVGTAVFLGALFYPLCVEQGQCDYLKLWMFVGIPFGVQRMFLWIIPRGFDIGGTVGMFVFNLLIGGVIGGFVLVWRLLQPDLPDADGGLLSGENGGYRDFKIGKCQNTVKCLQKKK